MKTITITEFQKKGPSAVFEQMKDESEYLHVKMQNNKDVIILSKDAWDTLQETLHVLQNDQLMDQIRESLKSHAMNSGYRPNQEEMDEIHRV